MSNLLCKTYYLYSIAPTVFFDFWVPSAKGKFRKITFSKLTLSNTFNFNITSNKYSIVLSGLSFGLDWAS